MLRAKACLPLPLMMPIAVLLDCAMRGTLPAKDTPLESSAPKPPGATTCNLYNGPAVPMPTLPVANTVRGLPAGEVNLDRFMAPTPLITVDCHSHCWPFAAPSPSLSAEAPVGLSTCRARPPEMAVVGFVVPTPTFPPP